MPEIIAQGVDPGDRWRRRLNDGQTIILGRGPGTWAVPWDELISRRHATAILAGGSLTVERLPDARNPLYFQGHTCGRCRLRPGQHFVIGSTTFSLVDQPMTFGEAGRLMTEHTFSPELVRGTSFRDASQRIEALSRLPELIPADISEEELCSRLVRFLLSGIARASSAAVVAWRPTTGAANVEVLQWDDRRGSRPALPVSEALIRQACEGHMTVAHAWTNTGDSPDPDNATKCWAFCTPLRRESTAGWCLYVAGYDAGVMDSPQESADLQDDVKFAELVADTVGRIRALRSLERRQAALTQFISPVVIDRLGDDDPEQLLVPREAEVSVLFCDLRGFSRVSEKSAHDLMGLLQRVSGALGVMTQHILAQGGIIGDFHGDAAMGFWGWPLDQPDRVARACRAALGISAEFRESAAQPRHPLANFRVGIGIASGRAVAGRIGTSDQVKISVFGPVVNLAARLQDLTKQLRAPILTDALTADVVRSQLTGELARVRRIANIRPRGMDLPVMVHELLPPFAVMPTLGDDHLAAYEAALDQLVAGDWDRAFSLLHRVPAEDRVKDFLTVLIAQHHRTPPPGWNGIIDLSHSEP